MRVIRRCEKGVKERNGVPHKVLDAGLHLYIPIYESIYTVSTLPDILSVSVQCLSADGRHVEMDVHITFSIHNVMKNIYSVRDHMSYIDMKVKYCCRSIISSNHSSVLEKTVDDLIKDSISSELERIGCSLDSMTTTIVGIDREVFRETSMIGEVEEDVITDIRESLLSTKSTFPY